MIIGNGLVANAFKEYKSSPKFLVFASGVSNSKSSLPKDYQREKELLNLAIQDNQDKTLVYFSTCSIKDPDLASTDYVIHKIEMEDLIKKNASSFHIFRLSNLAGFSQNKNTILNFFNYKICHDLPFEYWKNAERNIIDVTDVFRIVDYVIQNNILLNQTMNVANPSNYTVSYIVRCLESFYQKKALALERERGVPYRIDVSYMLPVIEFLGIRFAENYLPELLKKYYS